MNYIAYYRVSTQNQGKSGLGLDVQKEKIRRYIEEDDERELLEEYIEVQSGKKNKRVELDKALTRCMKTNSTLLIYKLDRFSRKVSFISNIMERGIKFIVVDMPSANTFQLHIYAALSEEEGRVISERTKLALYQAKQRGVVLGKHGKELGRMNSIKSKQFISTIKDRIIDMRSNRLNYTQIANKLNEEGIKSIMGRKFYSKTIANYVGEIEKM